MNTESISSIIEQAKNQRAEYIGGSIRKHPIATLLVVAIPVLLMQAQWSPSAPVASGVHDAPMCQSV